MSLDKNLFTLTIGASEHEPNAYDLIDPNDRIHYRKRRNITPTGMYSWSLYDPLSDSLLATVSSQAASSKQKTIELHNPSVFIDFKYTGTIMFKWTFDWEEHQFEWKRDSCHLLRKPDPPVLVAVTEQDRRNKSKANVQLLDYNLNRFEINDRKGLEIVLLSGLLTFQDYSDDYKTPKAQRTNSAESSTKNLAIAPPVRAPSPGMLPPPPPPKPVPPENIIALLQAQEGGELNEVTVSEEGSIPDYAQYCYNLLKDDAMLFMTVRAKSAEFVSKVVAIAEETKRLLHREGEDEIHQYVRYDEVPEEKKGKGPRIIKLDGPSEPSKPTKYKPPTTLTIHLSKIPMPELAPKPSIKPPTKQNVHRGNSPNAEPPRSKRTSPSHSPAGRPHSTYGALNTSHSSSNLQPPYPTSANSSGTKLHKSHSRHDAAPSLPSGHGYPQQDLKYGQNHPPPRHQQTAPPHVNTRPPSHTPYPSGPSPTFPVPTIPSFSSTSGSGPTFPSPGTPIYGSPPHNQHVPPSYSGQQLYTQPPQGQTGGLSPLHGSPHGTNVGASGAGASKSSTGFGGVFNIFRGSSGNK